MHFTKRKTIAASAVAALAGSLLMAAGTTAHAQSAGLRLMAVGDSITAGYRSSTGNGYRGPLWTELINQGDALDFVGSQRSGVMFDPDNEGYFGDRIDQIAGLINGELALYQPNVVLLHIGTNDLGQNYQVSTAPNRLASLIDQILAADPGVTILVAQLICNSTGWVQTDINNFNSQIPGIVQARVNAGKHVYTVSMSSLNLGDLNDGLHPNDGGYQKMADNWDAGIRQVIANGWVSHIDFAGVFEIQNQYSGQVVDVSGGSTSNNAPIVQWPYQGTSNQLWNFIPTSNGYYQIKNAGSALDLNVAGASTANGAKIVQWQFGNQGNDQWQPVRQSDGSYIFYNRNSGSVLDNPSGTTQAGQFDQWGWNGGQSNQRFNVIGR
ncbi:RICIN domain-containing protein [Capsulimonas corticalis]|nr:RICIN domain-containing protein [Capsulimonas corticalis]